MNLPTIGKTQDGTIVVDIFHLIHTHGLPLEIAIEALVRRGRMPSWIRFWEQAEEERWNPYSTWARLSAAVSDVLGPAFHAGWEIRMKHYIATRGLALKLPPV